MTIVCATHFTDSSLSAVRVAADLARKTSERLFLVTVQTDWAAVPKEHEEAALEALRLEAHALALDGCESVPVMIKGPLEGALKQFCRDKQADLLVVGDPSHPSTNPFVRGTLDKLADGLEIPFLVVRDPKPFDRWVKDGEPLQVLLALDHSRSSALARDWVSKLAGYGPIALTAVHLWSPRAEAERRRLREVPDVDGYEVLAAQLLKEARAALRGLPSNVQHKVHLEVGAHQIAERLLSLSADAKADLVVLGSHPNHGPLGRFWSVSHAILSDAPMTVACIPGGAVRQGPVTGPSPVPTHP